MLVLSCDRYSDLWAPFMAQFARHWGDCPYKRYLTTNHMDAAFDGFKTLKLGEDRSWSDNLKSALGMIQESYVLLFLEDLMLVKDVDRFLLAAVMRWVGKNEPAQVKLNATERPGEKKDELVGRVVEGAMYRTSTVATLWDKEILCALLEPGESAWEFELIGSARSDAFPGFYITYRDCFPVINSVIKGKWRRSAIRALARQGVEVDSTRRGSMRPLEELAFEAKQLRTEASKLIPMKYRRSLYARLVGLPGGTQAQGGPQSRS